MQFVSNNFSLLVMAVVIYGAGIFTGSIWTENAMLKSGTVARPSAAAGTADAGDSGPTAAQLASVPAPDSDDHIRGGQNAKVILIEYSDFECPYCAAFHPTMEKLTEELGDQVAWGYRHFPLSFHPNAQKAGEASECIYEQGGDDAFWKYADYVFAENAASGGITPETITAGAQEAGVNMDQFQTCLDSDQMADKILTDQATGLSAGVDGTPATVIMTSDGAQEIVVGAVPYDQIKAAVQKYL